MTEFALGPGSIRSYKRLSYTPWHALAEFVDNSTQAYFDNRAELDLAFVEEGKTLRVAIVYDSTAGTIEIADNSYGMTEATLDRAMTVGEPPPNPTGRSRYGMGLKTAACWLGNHWTVRTTQLGSEEELTVEVNVEAVASGESELPVTKAAVEASSHHTVVTISQMNVAFRGRRIGKTKDYLASMYREDLRAGGLELLWQGEPLAWQDVSGQFLLDPGGQPYRKDIDLEVGDKRFNGWVGILEHGSRSQAGFSIFHSGRMVRGYPDSWRPEEVFGQEQGSNNLINQRVVGEFHFDAFPVTHTKDDILWSDEEGEVVERAIREKIVDYLVRADTYRSRVRSGPQSGSVIKAKDKIRTDIQKPEASTTTAPTPENVDHRTAEAKATANRYSQVDADIDATVLGRRLRAYFTDEEARDALFAAFTHTDDDGVVVVANLKHPFLDETVSADALDLYLRLVVIDAAALAELDSWEESPRWIALRDALMRGLTQGGN